MALKYNSFLPVPEDKPALTILEDELQNKQRQVEDILGQIKTLQDRISKLPDDVPEMHDEDDEYDMKKFELKNLKKLINKKEKLNAIISGLTHLVFEIKRGEIVIEEDGTVRRPTSIEKINQPLHLPSPAQLPPPSQATQARASDETEAEVAERPAAMMAAEAKERDATEAAKKDWIAKTKADATAAAAREEKAWTALNMAKAKKAALRPKKGIATVFSMMRGKTKEMEGTEEAEANVNAARNEWVAAQSEAKLKKREADGAEEAESAKDFGRGWGGGSGKKKI